MRHSRWTFVDAVLFALPVFPMSAVVVSLLGRVGRKVANGIYHATGRRVRSLPITIEQLL